MMNTSIRCLLCIAFAGVFTPAIQAGEPALPKPAPSVETNLVGSYELKNKSSFALAADARAPFWPIGWTPRATGPAPVLGPKVTLDEASFKVTSILVGQPSLAVINNRAYSEGEFLRMPKGSAPIRIRVQRISDGSVTLQHEQQMLVVPLKRQVLVDKPDAPEELLNDER